MCSCRGRRRSSTPTLDAFFASVEQRDDPRLRGRPVIVGGGVVLAASYEAKAYGVRTAMGGAAGAPALPAGDRRPAAHGGVLGGEQGACTRVFEDTTPLVEGLSIDEAFLDVRGMERIAGTPVEIAVRLRRDVRERVGLPITVGIARTKFLAKVASGVAKPDGLLRRAARGRARVPAPAAGRAGLGRRADDGREAPRSRGIDHGRRSRARSPRTRCR